MKKNVSENGFNEGNPKSREEGERDRVRGGGGKGKRREGKKEWEEGKSDEE